MSQSLSNAPQPPSLFCIASSHAWPRAIDALAREVLGLAREADARESAIRTSAVSSVSGYHSLAYSKYQPPGSAAGQAFFQSPTFLTSVSSSQRAALSSAGSSAGRPPSESASIASAVSHTGEKQGWTWSVSSSSSSSFSSSWTWASQARVVRARSRGSGRR